MVAAYMALTGGMSFLSSNDYEKQNTKHEFSEKELEKLETLFGKQKKRYVKELNRKYDSLLGNNK